MLSIKLPPIVLTLLLIITAPSLPLSTAQELAPQTTTPDTQLFLPSGDSFSLNSATTGTRTIILFYRGWWCPYGRHMLKELRSIEESLIQLDFQILAISPDRPLYTRKLTQELGLTFFLLSDREGATMNAFKLNRTPPTSLTKSLQKKHITLAETSGYAHGQVPAPAIYFISSKGIISHQIITKTPAELTEKNQILSIAKQLADWETGRLITPFKLQKGASLNQF